MSNPNFLFIFDTSFILSLVNTRMSSLISKITEILKVYGNISYIAPSIILKELPYHIREAIRSQKNLEFLENKIKIEELRKLQKINSSFDPKFFSYDEIGDYTIIQLAINNNSKEKITAIISNDEGIHNFISKAIPKEELKVIWGYNFLSFLALHAFEKKIADNLRKAAELQKKYLENYRKKQRRGVIELKDFEKIFVKITSSLDYLTEIKQSFDQFIKEKKLEDDIPNHLKEIGKILRDILAFIDLNDEFQVEENLDTLEEYLFKLKIRDRDKIKQLLAPYLISIFTELAKIYDQKNSLSASISALERAKSQFTFYTDSKKMVHIFVLLSWLHLLSGSNSIAKLYFNKIPENYVDTLVSKIKVLLQVILTIDLDLDKDLFNRLPEEEWYKLRDIMKICYNQNLCDKIIILIDRFADKIKFELDARHFALVNESIEGNPILNFLKNDFLIVKITKKANNVVINCSNSNLGEFDFNFPLTEKLSKATKGDVIFINTGLVKKITKPRPGIKTKGTIYFEEINDQNIQLKQFKKII